ncbi:MAG: HRDC domain-containing protein [Actinomycetales bacterium]|nr:HRDC domain-containing protein [Actinomycetales bacterium]
MRNLTAPEGGTPKVIENETEFSRALQELAGGTGPIAIDAERASGFKYSPRAYLIQLNRRNGGLHLLDPIALQNSPLIAKLSDLISQNESIIHASSQDLPCLREFGIHPKKLFDTELGARIAGFAKVGLAPLCENLLEISLAKEHSAVDWSIRPLRNEWLDYAALDVAVLIDLRDKVEAALRDSNKLAWAEEEFAASLKAELPKTRPEPWRRTSGMHQIRSRFELAIIRSLWQARDEIAKKIDLAPGRLLNDAVIIELARNKPKKREEFLEIPIVKMRIRNEIQISYINRWLSVLNEAYRIPEENWPEMRARGDSLPAPRIWRDKFPIANAQLQHVRRSLAEISEKYSIPQENLLSPEILKRIIFNNGKESPTPDSPLARLNLVEVLGTLGARKWQIDLVFDAISRARCETEPPSEPEPPEPVHTTS